MIFLKLLMFGTEASSNVLLELNTQDTLQLMLDPAVNYDNIMQRNLNIYKWFTGKRKVKMLHLNRPSNMLQPKSGCEDWNPNINLRLRPDELEGCEFEINGEQCPDTFEEGCLQNMQAAPEEGRRFNTLFGQDRMYDMFEMAVLMQIRKGLVDDMYKVGWFGDINFAQRVAAGECDLSHLDPKEKENMIKMLQHCNGWWSEIRARTMLPKSDKFGHVPYVDTNNGTSSGNAMRPENICAYLRTMRSHANPILQFWNLNKPISERPCYLLQKGLYDALIQFYQSLDCCHAMELKINGEPIPGVYMFEGFPVVMMPEWTMYDFECGNINPDTGYSYHQRALFTAKENFCGITRGNTLAGRPQNSFVVEKDPSLKAKGKSYMYGCFTMGFGIAHASLVVAGWNSSVDYKM